MLKRVSAVWMPLALVALLLGYWAGQQGARPGASAPAALAGSSRTPDDADKAPGEETPKPDTQVPPDPPTTASTTGGWDTSGTPGGTTDPADSMTNWGSSTGGSDTGTTSRYGSDYETDPSLDEGADTGLTNPPDEGSRYGTGTDTGTGYDTGSTTDYGTDTTTDYGTGTGADYGTDATTDYGTGTGTDYGTDTTTRVTRELAYTFHVFDDFESANHWAVESAADHAVIALVKDDEKKLQGEKALKATFKAFGKGNFELRREVNLDLTDATTVKVDVYNEAGPMDLALGCRAGYDTTLFTTPPKPLVKGMNQDVTFRLADLSSNDASAFGTSWTWSRDSVSRISLIFHEREEKEGTVYIDNLRFDRPSDKLGYKPRPELKTIVESGKLVERFEPFTLAVDFEADYQDFFDRTEIDVVASFFSPSGKRRDVHGFVTGVDPETAKAVWQVRFTPDEVGGWRYDVTVKTAGGETASATRGFTCRRQADRKGFIRRSERDGRCFEFDDGSFYYPIGQNVCWASNYEYYLDKIQAYGGNYVRVWLCPWNLQLEDPREPGKLDLRVADAIDALLAQCERRGIYVQLVLRYHGMHQADWAKSPYNSANGGPCYAAGQFFTDLAARDQHKQFLDYVVARWAHSPALFAWELWNEADLARADRDTDLVAWHKEMAAYIKKIDVYRHLVTTSVASAGRCPELFELGNIDFVPVHFYARDVLKHTYDSYLRYRHLGKPVLVGEFSGGHKPADDLADTAGVRIHAGLWMTFVTPMAGNAMPWWWDTYIDKNDLYSHWAALARFAEGVDRRGKAFEILRSKVKVGEDVSVSMQGIVAPSEAYLWVYDEARVLRPEQAGRPLLPAARPVKLAGLLGGAFRVEIWDTHKGEVLDAKTLETADGVLSFTLPKCDRDIAVKIVKQGEAAPRLDW